MRKWALIIPVLILSRMLLGQSNDSHLRIRTITAGVNLSNLSDTTTLLHAVAFLNKMRNVSCALITDVIKNLEIKTCVYSGLMLPVIEDKLLARRAAE